MRQNLNWSRAFATVFLAVSVLVGVAGAEDRQEPPSPLSLQLRQLQREAAADPSSVEKFWQECAGKCPFVEPTDDPKRFLVTFLWRGDADVSRVEARGGPYRNSRVPFERLPETDVWYRSEILPADARFVYGLIVTVVVEQRASDGGVRRERVNTYP